MIKIEVRFGGKKSPRRWKLEESPSLLAVRTIERKPVDRVHFKSPTHRDLLKHNRIFQVRSAGVEVYDVSSQKTRDAFRAALTAEPEIQFAGRVLRTASGAPVLYTENLFVKFLDAAEDLECRAIIEKHGLAVVKELGFAKNAYFAKAPEGTGLKVFAIAEQLLTEKKVELCHPELVTERAHKAANPNQWHLKRSIIGGRAVNQHASVEEAWPKSVGAGTTIAVIDDGVDTSHPEFASAEKIASPRDITNGTDDPRPGHGDNHGTACAGVACADGVGSPGASGVAPRARLMPIRLASGLGSLEEAMAFYHAADSGADVISCSWGPPDGPWWDDQDARHNDVVPMPDSTQKAIEYCIEHGRGGKGCVITWAAGNGNESADNDGYAAHEKVIAVAACNDLGEKSDYSDYGDCVWCAFPSSQGRRSITPGIWTTDRRGKQGYNPGVAELGDAAGNYTNDFGGTSSACPGAAGIAALILSVNPELRWDQVRQIMADTADKIDRGGGLYDAKGHSAKYGHGRLNAKKAVDAAIRMGGAPRSFSHASEARSAELPRPAAEKTDLLRELLAVHRQQAKNIASLMGMSASRAAERDVTDVVIAILNETTDVPFGYDSSLSADLGINTLGRWDALANSIRKALPAFPLSGRELRQKMGPPRGDTVGKLISVIRESLR